MQINQSSQLIAFHPKGVVLFIVPPIIYVCCAFGPCSSLQLFDAVMLLTKRRLSALLELYSCTHLTVSGLCPFLPCRGMWSTGVACPGNIHLLIIWVSLSIHALFVSLHSCG